MCRTVHALLQTVICGIQMLVRVFMTVILMIENLIRMILQTMYNFISFLLQMISLVPICAVFMLTSKLKCFMCGGGGACPVNRGGACDCIMSALAIIILFFIFRATGVLDKIFYSIGYIKTKSALKFVPTPGDITECSRNDTDYSDADALRDAPMMALESTFFYDVIATRDNSLQEDTQDNIVSEPQTETQTATNYNLMLKKLMRTPNPIDMSANWTTILSYLAE